MKNAQRHLTAVQTELRNHVFFTRLAANPPLSAAAPFTAQGAFFVLGFRDLVQIIEERMSDPDLQDLLRRHRQEEVNHDDWFLRDITRLLGAPPTLEALFGLAHTPTRRGTYGLIAEALGARDDVERLCLLLSLEAYGEVCFGAIEAYFQRCGVAKELVFFAGQHVEAEQDHSIFEAQMQAILGGIELDPAALTRAEGAIDRSYRWFRLIADGLSNAIDVWPGEEARES